MSAKGRTAWFWSDWSGDAAVRRLTPAERGMWIDLLCLAADGNPKGYVTDVSGRPLSHVEIARFANCASPVEAAELIAGILKAGAASCDRSGRLFNRRMVRDTELAAKRSRAGLVGAASTKLKWQSFNAMSQQTAWQVPQQTGITLSNKSKLTSPVTAAARGSPVDNSTAAAVAPSQSKGTSEMETAAPSRPDQTSRASLEAIYAMKRGNQC